jgi:hypothetical protein
MYSFSYAETSRVPTSEQKGGSHVDSEYVHTPFGWVTRQHVHHTRILRPPLDVEISEIAWAECRPIGIDLDESTRKFLNALRTVGFVAISLLPLPFAGGWSEDEVDRSPMDSPGTIFIYLKSGQVLKRWFPGIQFDDAFRFTEAIRTHLRERYTALAAPSDPAAAA